MDSSTAQKVIAGCILIIWTVGLVHATLCQESLDGYGNQFVNVCQDNTASVENSSAYIVLDPAGAPLQQAITCKCFLSFGKRQSYIVHLVSNGDVAKNFKTNASVVRNKTAIIMNITMKTELIYAQEKKDDHPRGCMAISNADAIKRLTVECEDFRKEIPRASTTELTTTPAPTRSMSKKTSTLSMLKETSTHPMSAKTSTLSITRDTSTHSISTKTPTYSMSKETPTHTKSTRPVTRPMLESSSARSMLDETSTLSMHTDKEGSTSILTAIICTIIGVVVFLIGIVVITVCCVVKRKRRSTDVEVSEDSNSKRMGPSREQTDAASGSTMGNTAASQKTVDKHDSIMPSEYVDIEQGGVTASAKIKPETVQAESDVYNHLNEVQPGPHSDNVYSTTHVYSATKQESDAISKRGPMTSESDVYNHLNEVRPGQHSDNIYNAVNLQDTSMQKSGATSSQYDSVELVKRKHHAPPESDYNVLSFP